jgi:hypothetical protein
VDFRVAVRVAVILSWLTVVLLLTLVVVLFGYDKIIR